MPDSPALRFFVSHPDYADGDLLTLEGAAAAGLAVNGRTLYDPVDGVTVVGHALTFHVETIGPDHPANEGVDPSCLYTRRIVIEGLPSAGFTPPAADEDPFFALMPEPVRAFVVRLMDENDLDASTASREHWTQRGADSVEKCDFWQRTDA